MVGAALTVARFLGRSRMVSVFGGLVAVAGLVHELQRRKEKGSNTSSEA
jgi:hypothetical protein